MRINVFAVINQTNTYKATIYNYCIYSQIIIKIFLLFFFTMYIRMNGKSINFHNKNIKKSDLYNKNKKIFNIDDIDANKILVSKK